MRLLAALGLAAALTAATAGPAAAGSNQSPLIGPNANLTCGTNWSERGEIVDQDGPGTVKLTTRGGRVKAVVRLRGATPNTPYQVRLSQNSNDCRTIDYTIVTDGRGRGSATVVEPIVWRVVVVNVDENSYASGGNRWRGQPLHTGWTP